MVYRADMIFQLNARFARAALQINVVHRLYRRIGAQSMPKIPLLPSYAEISTKQRPRTDQRVRFQFFEIQRSLMSISIRQLCRRQDRKNIPCQAKIMLAE